MRKIVITPGITDLNRGDQALIWLIKDILERDGVLIDAKLLQTGNNEEDIYMQSRQSIARGYDVMMPLLLHPARNKETDDIAYSFSVKLKWGLTALKDLLNTSMLLSRNKYINKLGRSKLNKQQQKTYKCFQEMDLLIVKGGGFLHTYKRITDIYYLYFNLFNIMLAQRLDKKIVVMPNSYGPFMGKIEQFIVKRVMKNVDLIYARENISGRYLQNLLGRDVYFSPDLGFYINPGKTDCNIPLPKSGKKVAITMRPYRFPEYTDSQKRYLRYINEMFIVSRRLIENGYHPVFVAHTLGPSAHEDDRIALNRVIEKLKDEGISNEDYTYVDDRNMDCYAITDLYSQVDYIIGTRFHSVIFAMTSIKPAIAISYSGNKTIGIMMDMGLEDYVVKIGELNSEVLLNKFYKLVAEEDTVKGKIKKYLADCETYKDQLIMQVKNILMNE
jgi:colanic acid/amylovoran biosynthesis protein